MSSDYPKLTIQTKLTLEYFKFCEHYLSSFDLKNGKLFINVFDGCLEIDCYGNVKECQLNIWRECCNIDTLFYFNELTDTWYDVMAFFMKTPNFISWSIHKDHLILQVRYDTYRDYVVIRRNCLEYQYIYKYGGECHVEKYTIYKNAFNTFRPGSDDTKIISKTNPTIRLIDDKKIVNSGPISAAQLKLKFTTAMKITMGCTPDVMFKFVDA